MSEVHEPAQRSSFPTEPARIGRICAGVEHLNILRVTKSCCHG